jgi:hypothetical protein
MPNSQADRITTVLPTAYLADDDGSRVSNMQEFLLSPHLSADGDLTLRVLLRDSFKINRGDGQASHLRLAWGAWQTMQPLECPVTQHRTRCIDVTVADAVIVIHAPSRD